MADGNWMEKAFGDKSQKGSLRRITKTKEGRNISDRALGKAEKSRNPTVRKKANLAETARKIAARRSR